MKRTITLMTFMMLTSSMVWSQFVEEFRSPRNRRPPASLTAQIDGYRAPTDFNGNGSEDVSSIWRDSLPFLFLRDGNDFETILSMPIANGETNFEITEFTLRSPGDPNNYLTVTHAVGYNGGRTPGMTIYDIDNGDIVYSAPDMIYIGVADFDRGGLPEILAWDVANRQTIILGYKDADFQGNEPESDGMIDALGGAYLLELKFQGRPQRRMADFLDLDEARRKFDANGDGRPEMILFKVNDQNEETGIEVINPANGNVVWDYDYPAEHLDEMRSAFHGFLDVNGDDEHELFFGNKLVVTFDKEVHVIADGFEIAGFNDFNNDGYPEVIGYNAVEDKVQVWGMPRSTSVREDRSAMDGFQVSIGPNPFENTTDYWIELAEGADVQLDIINPQGQLVARLLSGWREAGRHSGSITELPGSGLFFATWRVNGFVAQTQQIIKK